MGCSGSISGRLFARSSHFRALKSNLKRDNNVIAIDRRGREGFVITCRCRLCNRIPEFLRLCTWRHLCKLSTFRTDPADDCARRWESRGAECDMLSRAEASQASPCLSTAYRRDMTFRRKRQASCRILALSSMPARRESRRLRWDHRRSFAMSSIRSWSRAAPCRDCESLNPRGSCSRRTRTGCCCRTLSDGLKNWFRQNLLTFKFFFSTTHRFSVLAHTNLCVNVL